MSESTDDSLGFNKVISEEQTENHQLFLVDFPASPMAVSECRRILDLGGDFPDWKKRIEGRFEKESNWDLLQIHDGNGVQGFVLLSRSSDKLAKWSDKFIKAGWIRDVLTFDRCVQLAYFYILPEGRNEGMGAIALQETFDWCRSKGIEKLLGFTHYERSLNLYQRLGCKILGQSQSKNPGTYFMWDLGSSEM